MLNRTLTLIACAGLAGGCFSPEVDPDAGTDAATSGDASSSSGGSETAGPTGSPTTDTPTTTDPTGDTETTADPTTHDPTTTDPTGDTETTTDPTTGGEDPYCGDGNVDPGEDCDDGLDNNGLDQSCLPDCNLNVCGDGNLGPDEFCDDGADDNVLEVGACAPDCSTVIEEKVITTGAFFDDPNLGGNPVATADGACEPGYLAMFVVPGQRIATTTPYGSDGSVDWVVHPFTYYVNFEGTHIWTTDDTPLLGVRDGAQQDLLGPVTTEFAQDFYDFQIITGMNADWTAANSNTCNGWGSKGEALMARFGLPSTTQMPDVINDFSGPCADWSRSGGAPLVLYFDSTTVYCAEQ